MLEEVAVIAVMINKRRGGVEGKLTAGLSSEIRLLKVFLITYCPLDLFLNLDQKNFFQLIVK